MRNKPALHFGIAALAAFVLCAVLFAAAVEYAMGVPLGNNVWADQLWQKKTALAARIGGSRILLVGGSNVQFGISARQIGNAFGVPTLNFGTYYVLHSDYMIGRIKRLAHRGDIVVMALEYPIYYQRNALNLGLIDYLLEYDPSYIRALPLAERAKLIWNVPFYRVYKGDIAHVRHTSPGKESSLFDYDARTIDAYGDETINEPGQQPAQKLEVLRRRIDALGPDTDLIGQHPSSSEMQKVIDFARWGRQRGITVAVTWPSDIFFVAYDEPANRELFDQLTDGFRNAGVPTLGQPRDFMYDKKYFFDSSHHLTDAGRTLRTDRLIEAMALVLHLHLRGDNAGH